MLKRINSLGGLLDLTADDLWNKLCCKLGERAAGGLPLHDLSHFLPDSTDLRRAGVCGFFDLVRASLGECNSEQPKKVIIGRFYSNVGLDKRLPFAHQGS